MLTQKRNVLKLYRSLLRETTALPDVDMKLYLARRIPTDFRQHTSDQPDRDYAHGLEQLELLKRFFSSSVDFVCHIPYPSPSGPLFFFRCALMGAHPWWIIISHVYPRRNFEVLFDLAIYTWLNSSSLLYIKNDCSEFDREILILSWFPGISKSMEFTILVPWAHL